MVEYLIWKYKLMILLMQQQQSHQVQSENCYSFVLTNINMFVLIDLDKLQIFKRAMN